jgi:hypothetical protein
MPADSYSESDRWMVRQSPRTLYIARDRGRIAPQVGDRRTIMNDEPSPLKYMGTQSQETVGMAAALALAAERAKERRSFDGDRFAGDGDSAGSKIADIANWALAQGKDALDSIAANLRDRANVALARYTKDDPSGRC